MTKDTKLMEVDVSDVKKPTASSIDSLQRTTVTGFQYVGNFLHVVAQDDDVSVLNDCYLCMNNFKCVRRLFKLQQLSCTSKF